VALGLLWVVTVLEVLAMGSAGLAKFLSMDGWMYWFERFGYPARFSLVIGALEFVGAGILLLPRWASYAAGVLGVIMIGALHAVTTHETDLGVNAPLIHVAFLAVIGTARWRVRWRPGHARDAAP
jgi:uncharacterized membrane protein YphA (DoxX/SURF4 family)